MIEIPRPRLVEELVELTRRGSVMVSGAPGIGKSWVLAQLVRRFKKESRRVMTLAAEDFQVSNLQQIYDSLKFTKPLPKLLAALPDPVLIIDGLDALRGEASQRAFRELIREVTEQAPNAAIIASVRTFDLQESPELQRLQTRYSGSGRGMQRFVIGELTDLELLE
jgi:DNA replication protein DnaC